MAAWCSTKFGPRNDLFMRRWPLPVRCATGSWFDMQAAPRLKPGGLGHADFDAGSNSGELSEDEAGLAGRRSCRPHRLPTVIRLGQYAYFDMARLAHAANGKRCAKLNPGSDQRRIRRGALRFRGAGAGVSSSTTTKRLTGSGVSLGGRREGAACCSPAANSDRAVGNKPEP